MSGSLTQPTPPATATATATAGTAPVTAGAAEFVRIGVAGPASRADLAVPAGVPLARLMPTLLRHAGEDPTQDGGVRHGGWVLRRADGTRLDPAASLAAQGVHEGDLLFVGHGTDDTTPPLYDDVTEVIGAAAGPVGWPPAATRRAAGTLAAVGVLAACAALAEAPDRLPGWLGLATAALTLLVGVLMSRAFGDREAGTFAAVLAAPPAMLGAVRLLGTEQGTVAGFTAGHLLLACAVLAVIGALGPVLVGGGDGTFTALVVAGPLAATGALICAVWDVHPARAAAVAAPLALALTTLWPTVALRVARIPAPQVAASAEDLEALPSQLEHDRLRERIARARRLLVGMLVGSHLVTAAGTLVLFGSGELWSSVLGGVLLALTLMRARLFRETAQAAIPLATGLVTVAGAAAFLLTDRVGERLPLLGVALPVALLVALIAGGVAVSAGRFRANPRLSRGLDLLESVLLLAVIPLCLAVWEVYSALLNLRV
ncbi:type VII secretion integral membrane protein EccD [Streptomyces sp. NPDC127098]|uniref:type VII secretion integral membrane protein EccD n=1 Tax=Streptomyces sp. NPDC127098 TaxID=3347137 RepID=UPI00365E3DB1